MPTIKKKVLFLMICSVISTASSAEAQHRLSPEDSTVTSQAISRKKRNHPNRYGGTLRWGTSNPPTIINPILTSHSVSASLNEIIFDSLIRIDSLEKVVPGLAESWDVSEDGLEYTFIIRKGVKFHDGEELTAEDVVFTYEQILDPSNNSPFRSHFEPVKYMEAVNKYEVKFVLERPFPYFINKLVRGIVPQHVLEGQILHKGVFNYFPVGTGPFKFRKWDRGLNEIELAANEDYFEGRPYLDRIVIKTYPNISKFWSAFMRNEVDLVKFIDRKDYEIILKDPSFKVYEIPGEFYYAIVYNLNDPVFSDFVVRKAISLGINKREIINTLFAGNGTESSGPFHMRTFGYDANVQPIEYNPQKAIQILRDSGWMDHDGDGILEREGKDLELVLMVDERKEINKRMAKRIRQQLSAIGIRVKLKLFNGEKELENYPKELRLTNAWLRMLDGVGTDSENYEAALQWYSLSSEFGKIWQNKDETVDRLFELGQKTKEIKKRQEIFQRIHKTIYEKQLASFLFYPTSYHAVSSNFGNTDKLFTVSMPDYIIKDWYLSN